MNTHILHTCHRVTNLQSQDSSNMWLTQYFGGINAGLLTSLSFYNKKHTLRDSSISSIQSIRHSRHHQLQHPQFRGQPHTHSLAENPGFASGKLGKSNLSTIRSAMAVLSESHDNLPVNCKKRKEDPCSCGPHQDQILPKRELSPCAECVKTPTIPEKRNVKEGRKQEKEERQDGGKISGI